MIVRLLSSSCVILIIISSRCNRCYTRNLYHHRHYQISMCVCVCARRQLSRMQTGAGMRETLCGKGDGDAGEGQFRER